MKILSREFLPCKTTSAHAATIEWWKDHFVYAWFGGTAEGQPDVAIYVYNLNNKGETIVIGNKDQYPRWNPILYSYQERLYLFEKVGLFCDRWQTVIHDITEWKSSNDVYDKTRKSSQFLPCGLNGPVKLRPVIISSDQSESILCGSSFETFADWTSYVEEYRVVNGIWTNVGRSNPLVVKDKVMYADPFSGMPRMSLGIIQPSLWIDNNGICKAFFRSSHGLNKIYYSEMDDKKVWSLPVPTNIVNNNSGVSTVYMNGNLYLAFNNSDKYRFPLQIQRIKQTSNAQFEIDKEQDTLLIADKDAEIMEFSYPYMIENQGLIHLVYTHGRVVIEHCVIDPN